ncbi:glucose-1-phosphate cytidylyltransferase [Acidocella aquatica]|uniref:Glucose-1-phosphate cytidylyltransferase n=1 Tax=Acidocella aquatica TaxID=1922313 RepID=A0ABQ6AE54_9PROT|nr:glucose-1-phosphate cytidylyltransferase [Acidocella aquatica]GLR68330.1 glucose-1-phosphate cytidylyltransferase [Acidocella aquatica]
MTHEALPLRGVKAVILAGGRGSRLSEETDSKPKPMVEIGGRPILWHIMKIYAQYGIEDFIICLGYKGARIKEYFYNYNLHSSDITVDLRSGITIHRSEAEDWRVTLVETGLETQTGGRLAKIRKYLGDDALFCMTYGDAVADIDIGAALQFHKNHGKLATVAAVRPLARFGALHLAGDLVDRFEEKPVEESGLISGGFFVLSPVALDLIEGDATLWEKEPMEKLAAAGELMAYRHHGFWQPMDTLRDRMLLDHFCETGTAPWMTWQG